MKINWKLRLKNKTTLAAIFSATVVFGYSVATALGVTPDVDQATIINGGMAVLTVLAALGVIIDPTTQGINDSDRAMSYDEPN